MPPVAFDPTRTFWTGPEVASLCRRSERWVYRQVDSGDLVAAERGRGTRLLITGKSLHKYLERCGAL